MKCCICIHNENGVVIVMDPLTESYRLVARKCQYSRMSARNIVVDIVRKLQGKSVTSYLLMSINDIKRVCNVKILVCDTRLRSTFR